MNQVATITPSTSVTHTDFMIPNFERAPSPSIGQLPHIPKALTCISGKIGQGWVITQPLAIQIEKEEDGSYIVCDEIFFVFGVGGTDIDAMLDYETSLTEYYELVADGIRSNPHD